MHLTRKIAALFVAGATVATLTACQGDTTGSSDDGAPGSTAPSQDGETAAAGPASGTLTADDFVERTATALSTISTTTFEAEYSGSLAGEGAGVATTFDGEAMYGETPDSVAIQMTTNLDEDLIKLDDQNIWAKDQETDGKYLHLTDPDPGYVFRDEQFTDVNVYARTVALDGAVTAVEDRGTETVGGTETHHYVVTVDLAAADLTALGFDESAAAETGSIDVEYFLDSTDLPLRTIIPAPVPGQTLVHTMNITYNTEPSGIEAPPADQTITAADLDA
ncbi:hypothetical protein GCM10027059_46680 [Myceligenerans halotolerans]